MAIPQMFNPIKPPIQTGVLWALWQKVTPKTVKTTGEAIKKQEVAKAQAAQSAPMDFSEKEIAFLKQVKAQGMDKNEALAYIQSKRQQPVQEQATQQSTFWQKIRQAVAPAVWALQWFSDVWQNIIGKPIEAAARGTLWLFGVDTSKLQQWVTKWNILPTVLWDQSSSIGAKVGRLWWQFAGTAALTAPVGWIIGAWVKWALWPAWTVAWWLARWALSWWATGAAGTQIGSLGTRGKAATAKETAVWAALWWVIWWALWGRAVSQSNKVQNLFAEKWTAKKLEQAAREGRVKFTSWALKQRWEITPTERVANWVKVLSDKIKNISSKDPQKIINEANNIGRKMAADLSDDLKNIKVGTMTRFKAGLTNQIDEVAGLTDERTNSQIKQISNLKNKIPKAKTADDLWKIRMEWDDLFSEAQKNATDVSGASTRKAKALRQSVRNILNNQLDDVVSSQWWPNVKKSFYDMSSIIEAKNNLIINIPNLVKEQPTILMKWLKWAGTVAAWYGVWEALKSLWQ